MCLPSGKRLIGPRMRTVARAVNGPTPGCGELSVEIVDAHRQPPQQLEIVISTAGGVTGEGEPCEGGAPTLRPELRAECQAIVQRNGLKAILDHCSHPHQADPVGNEGAELT